jgi:hypothetical protein
MLLLTSITTDYMKNHAFSTKNPRRGFGRKLSEQTKYIVKVNVHV